METLIYLGKSAAILGLFYIVYIAVLRKDTFFTANRHYLLSGIFAAIVIPFVSYTKTTYIEISQISNVAFSEVGGLTPMVAAQEVSTINWWYVLLAIYGMGVIVMLFRFLRQLYSLHGLLNRYPSEKENGYTYIKVNKDLAPFSFFRFIVYNPSIHTQDELSMILRHERVHGSQWHSIDILIANIILIFQWINPIAWFYKKGIEENLEYLADSATVQQVQSVKQYQLALVKASSTLPIPALTTNFYQSFIKKRIVMLNKSTSNKINVWKLSIVLPLLAIFFWSFNVNEVIAYKEIATTTSEAKDISEKINENQIVDHDLLEEEPVSELNTRVTSNSNSQESNSMEVISTSERSEKVSENTVELKDIILTISSDTTEDELKAMKTKLEKAGFTFNYSNLKYNSENEITGITIKYKDANGNSGNYSVNSDSPINTIVVKSSGDRISINNSGGNYGYSFNTDEEIERHHELRRKEMEVQQEHMEERQKEMEVIHEEMEERQKEMEVLHEEKKQRQEEMQVKRIEMREKMQEERMKKHEEMLKHREESGLEHDNKYNNLLSTNELKRITKDASNRDLEKLKSEFNSEGTSFSFSSVKRNEKGEITKIKLKLNNNNGSVSTSTYNNDGKPIKPIFIGVNDGTTIMSNRPH